MRYNLESALPIKAFSPRVKGPFSRGMTLEGGGGGGGFNPVSWVGGAVNSIGSIFSKIDPGPAIGNIGAQIDSSVRSAVPGGWATLGVAALAIAAPYLAPYLAEAAPALTVGEGSALAGTGAGAAAGEAGYAGAASVGNLAPSVAGSIGTSAGSAAGAGVGLTGAAGTGAGAGIGLGTGAGALGSGVAGLGGAAGAGLTSGGLGAGPTSILGNLLSSAGTGSLYGGGMGTANSLIRGTDPLKGALTGALMGGLTGASLSGIGQTLAQYGISSPALSSAILSASKGLASGANPSTILANTALNTGLSSLGNLASTSLTQAGVDPNISKILASTGLGAAKAGATGGDPLTGAENAALGSTLGLGLGTGKDLLMAPSASTTPATIHDYSTPIPDRTVSLTGVDNPVSVDLASQYLKNQADQISSDLSKYYPSLSQQQATLADTASKANDIYTQNQADKTALTNAINETNYNDLRAHANELLSPAQSLSAQINPLQEQYDAAVKKYEDSGRTDRASYDLANSLAPKLNDLIPQFNAAYSAFDAANQNLASVYKTNIEPLYTAFTTSSDNLKTALTDYSNNNAELAKTSNAIAGDLQNLDKISQGQLVSGLSTGEATMQAPSATSVALGAVNNVATALSGSANATPTDTTQAATPAAQTVQGTYGYDSSGQPAVFFKNPITGETFSPPDISIAGNVTSGSAAPYYLSFSTDKNGNVGYSETEPPPDIPKTDASGTSAQDQAIIDQQLADTTAGAQSGVGTNAANTPTGGTTPTDSNTTGGLPATGGGTTSGTTDLGNLPVTPPATGGGTAPADGGLPSTTGTTDLANLPVAPPATGGGTAPTGGGLPSTTDTGTIAGTGTGTTAGTGTGTGAAAAGLTAAGLAAALAGMGGGSSASSGSPSAGTTPTTPKGTFVKGSQIASPLGSFNVPTISYATPAPDPNALEEIQNAATGGIMHLAAGGSYEDYLATKPVLMHGKQTQHANLFGLGGIPLYPVPGKAEGGAISQGFNPQFYSEGGLGSMQNTHVRGPGTGTSDSIPAMLSDGEFVIPADVVASLGNGSNDGGAKMLDSFLKTIRAHKQKHDAQHLPADSKGPLGYLLEAKRKVKK